MGADWFRVCVDIDRRQAVLGYSIDAVSYDGTVQSIFTTTRGFTGEITPEAAFDLCLKEVPLQLHLF